MLATWGTSTGFNPASLFAGGEQGAWYDPSDNLTMYDTASGAVQITAVEQAVGLILDKSKGLAIGSDVLSGVWLNAFTTTFDTFTSTSSDGFTATTTGAKSPRTRCAGSVSPGLWYEVTFTVETLTNASLIIWLADPAYSASAIASSGTISSVGTYTRIFGSASSGTAAGLLAIVNATGASTVTVSGITVKPLAGNHAYQATSASRPTLRARYNLLTYSEEFNNVAWTNTSSSVSPNATTAPDGTTTADKWIPDNGAATGAAFSSQTVTTVAAQYTFSIYAKQAGFSDFGIRIRDNATTENAVTVRFSLTTGSITSAPSAIGTFTVTSATASNVGDGWFRIVFIFTSTGAVAFRNRIFAGIDTGNGTDGFFVWGAQLVPTAVFPSNTYQRIAAATDYATGAAFPQYLAFDGTDDSLLTTNVDFATVTSDGQARRNLLLNPTQFDAAAWSILNAAIVANSTTAPDNTTTADTFNVTDATDTFKRMGQVLSPIPSGANVFSVYIKAGTQNFVQLLGTGDAEAFANFDVSAGTVGTSGSKTTASIQNVGDGWYRCIAAFSSSTVYTGGNFRITMQTSASAVYGGTTPNTGTFFLWGAQLETGSTATAFQNIGTDKMTVFGGVSKLSDAASGMFLELSASLSSNNGSFALQMPGSVSTDIRWNSKGTTGVVTTYNNAAVAAPVTFVNTGIGDIGNDICQLRVNGTQVASSVADQGTGNYGTYPLYIGRRNNASLPFNGRVFSLIVRGAESNSSQVAQTERYVASKTPLGVVP